MLFYVFHTLISISDSDYFRPSLTLDEEKIVRKVLLRFQKKLSGNVDLV